MHVYFIFFVVLSVISGVSRAESIPEGHLANWGEKRWWCPASNWGKAELEWSIEQTKEVERIRKDLNRYEPTYTFDNGDLHRVLGRSVGRLDTYWYDRRKKIYKMAVCTASIIEGDYLLTNHHCVNDSTAVLLRAEIRMDYLDSDHRGTVYEVETYPIEESEKKDYAILGVRDFPFKYYGKLAFKPRDPKPNESIFIIHHPAGLPQRVTRGCTASPIPAGKIRSEDDTLFTHNCSMEPGSSGSPMFAEDGTIIGLNYAHILPEFRTTTYKSWAPHYNLAKRPKKILEESPKLPHIVDTRGFYWLALAHQPHKQSIQTWGTRTSLKDTTDFIREKYKENYTVWDIKFDHNDGGMWSIVLNTTNAPQTFLSSSRWSEIEDFIREKDKEGYRLGPFVYGQGHYLCVMNKLDNGVQQDMRWYDSFQESEFNKWAEKGWELLQLAYVSDKSEKRFLAIWTTGPNETKAQPTRMIRSSTFPEDEIERLSQSGYRISSTYHYAHTWYVILTKPSSEYTGRIRWRFRYPTPEVTIRDFWDDEFMLNQLLRLKESE